MAWSPRLGNFHTLAPILRAVSGPRRGVRVAVRTRRAGIVALRPYRCDRGQARVGLHRVRASSDMISR